LPGEKWMPCAPHLGQALTSKSLSAGINLNALKDAYDYSCFLARSNR
jgi:hypothetical protein